MSEGDLLLFDKKSVLVSTLLKAYKKGTHKLFAKPLAIGGGTYAKEAKNTVAFGAEWEGHPGNMHAVDEYIYMDDFAKDIAIYARAIYMLGKAAK
jgi:succinyl-diaminopimelate desuccinylase